MSTAQLHDPLRRANLIRVAKSASGRVTALAEPPKHRSQKRKAEVVLNALLRGGTLADAARAGGIGERTLDSWLTQPWFRDMYQAAKDRLLDETINQLRTLGNHAIEALRDVLTDELSQPSAKVSAARCVLEILLRAIETQDIAVRLERLERDLGDELK